MKRFAVSGLACALAAVVVGCGPMQSPLPQRFDAENQKTIDESWDRAFTPVDRFDHQGLLDLMIGTQAYQFGVDMFSLRAEKHFAGGKVVMEVSFDRTKPDDDRFEVTVFDKEGKFVRLERFHRKEVEETYGALYVNLPPPIDANLPNQPKVAAPRAGHEARWNRIREIFPQPNEPVKPGPAPMVQPKG